jgi:hypothetical protein
MFVLLSHHAASLFKAWPFLRADSLPAHPVVAYRVAIRSSVEKD